MGTHIFPLHHFLLIHEDGRIRVNAAAENADLAKWDGKQVQLRIGETNYPSKELLSQRYKLHCEKSALR